MFGSRVLHSSITSRRGFLLGLGGHEEKVVPAIVEHRHFAADYPVGVGNYKALRRLSEYLLQLHRWHSSPGDKVPEHVSGAYRGQLIAVAHHDEPRARSDRMQQGFHQQGINHGHLVDYQHVAGKGILLLALERMRRRGEIHLQQTVYRLRRRPGKVCHSLCRASGGSGKFHLQLPLAAKRYHGIKRRGLTGTGTSGQNEHMVVHAAAYRLALELLVLYSLLPFYSGDLLGIIHAAAVVALYHLCELLRDVAFRTVVLRQEHELIVVFVAAHYLAALLRKHKPLPELLLRDVKLIGHCVGKVVLAHAGMSVIRVCAQAPDYPGECALFAVHGVIHLPGKPVCFPEWQVNTDTAQAPGIVLHRLYSVHFELLPRRRHHGGRQSVPREICDSLAQSGYPAEFLANL